MSAELASVQPAEASSNAVCPMVPLVEANRDGRLGEREAASLARHVAVCAHCRALANDLDEVRTLLHRSSMPPLSPLEHQRGRLALLRAAAAPLPPRPQPSRRPFALMAAAACVVLACLAVAAPKHLAAPTVTAARHLPANVLRAVPQAPPGAGTAEDPAVLAAAAAASTRPSPPQPPSPAARERGESATPSPPLPRSGRGGRGVRGAVGDEAAPADDASRDFNEAVETLGRGDYAAARSQLDAFRAAHPGDPRADLASFLTIVSLQHAGRHAEAQEAARRYLEMYPDSDRRAEVLRVAAGR